MSDLESWLSTNDQYLATRLDWLRGRLERLAGVDGVEESVALLTDHASRPSAPRTQVVKKRSLRERLFGSEAKSTRPTPALPRMSDVDETLAASSGETATMRTRQADAEPA